MNADDMTPSTEPRPEETQPSRVGRRGFLVGAGAAAGAALVANAFVDRSQSVRITEVGAAAPAPQPQVRGAASGDAATAAFAAGLEALAVATYKGALDAATAGKLGEVPPAGAEFVKTALAQHQAHQDAWNKVLTDAGQSPVTAPDPGLKPTVDREFAKVKDFAGAARLALKLEEIAAATYLKAIPTIANRDAVKLAASIQSVDAKHAAILHFVLGEYPVPDVFARTALAASPAATLPRTS